MNFSLVGNVEAVKVESFNNHRARPHFQGRLVFCVKASAVFFNYHRARLHSRRRLVFSLRASAVFFNNHRARPHFRRRIVLFLVASAVFSDWWWNAWSSMPARLLITWFRRGRSVPYILQSLGRLFRWLHSFVCALDVAEARNER